MNVNALTNLLKSLNSNYAHSSKDFKKKIKLIKCKVAVINGRSKRKYAKKDKYKHRLKTTRIRGTNAKLLRDA